METQTIFIFLLITLGIGSISFWAKFSNETIFEKIVISFGVGLALIPFAGVIFNLLRIPLDYRIFLSLAIILPAALFFRRFKKEKLSFSRLKPAIAWQDAGVILVFAASLFMYLRGSLGYSWLSSDDPYRFLAAAKYIEIEKTFTAIFQFNVTTQPYPQGYQILLAILSQASQSLNWTAKFFTSVLVSSSLLFFYCLANKMFFNKTTALLATAALASMPAWLTHYIYSMNFSLALLPIFFYSLEKTSRDKRWFLISTLIFASIWCIHFYSSFLITLLAGCYYLAKVICQNNLQKRIAASLFLGIIFSLAFWIPSCFIQFPGQKPGGVNIVIDFLSKLTQTKLSTLITSLFFLAIAILFLSSRLWIPKLKSFIQKYRLKYLKQAFFYLGLAGLMALLLIPEKIMPPIGSGSMPYSWHHFFAFRLAGNLTQNPFGIGPLPTIMGIIATLYLIYKTPRLFRRDFTNQTAIFFMAIFTFLGVNSIHFTINLAPFRMWQFFAFSTALLCGLSYNQLIAKKIKKNWPKIIIACLLILLFIPSWHHNKYKLNTSVWADNFIHVIQSQQLYGWVKDNLPKNSKTYSLGVSQSIPISHDMVSFIWDEEIKNYKNKDVEADPRNNYHFLKEKGYQYIIVDYPSVFSYTFNRSSLWRDKPQGRRKEKSLQRASTAMIKKEVMQRLNKFELIKEFEHGAIFKLKEK